MKNVEWWTHIVGGELVLDTPSGKLHFSIGVTPFSSERQFQQRMQDLSASVKHYLAEREPTKCP